MAFELRSERSIGKMFDSNQLKEKTVIVSGAASGMGRTTAVEFARRGARVHAWDVNPSLLTAFDDESTILEGTITPRIVDATSSSELDVAVSELLRTSGRLDIVASFVGVIQVANSVDGMPEEEWDRVLNVNLKSQFLMTRAVIPEMRKQNCGRIVLITSMWGQEGQKFFAAYCASKAGLLNFTQSLAKEVVDAGITVNSVAPGMINTELHQKSLRDQAVAEGKSYEEVREQEWSKCPMGYAADPIEITNGVLYLSSNEAKYITGATLDINGGASFR